MTQLGGGIEIARSDGNQAPGWQAGTKPCPYCGRRYGLGDTVTDAWGNTGVVQRDGFEYRPDAKGRFRLTHTLVVVWDRELIGLRVTWPAACQPTERKRPCT